MSHLQNCICRYLLLLVIGMCSSTSLWSNVLLKAQIVTASDGTKVSVWESSDGTTSIIEGATFDGISWSAPFTISAAGEQAVRPKILINSFGHVVVAWFNINSITQLTDLRAATKLLGFGFTAPVTVNSGTDNVSDFTISIDGLGANGNIYAIWEDVDPTSTFAVMFAQSPFGGVWSTPIQLR